MAKRSGQNPAFFPTTQWSTMARAGGDDDEVRASLGRFLERYDRPIKLHLAATGVRAQDVDDMAHGFITDRILLGDLLRRADRDRGRFRALLKTALERYVRSHHRRNTAKKRAPSGRSIVPLDGITGLSARDPGPDGALDRAWAVEVVAEAVRRTRDHYAEAERLDIWQAFELGFLGPTLHGESSPSRSDLARQVGYPSDAKVSNAIVTAKRMMARCLRDALLDYVGDEALVDQELADILAILEQPGHSAADKRV